MSRASQCQTGIPPYPSVSRVQMKPSPSFNVYYEQNPISLALDTGAETNLIKECTALQLGLKITPSSQYATSRRFLTIKNYWRN